MPKKRKPQSDVTHMTASSPSNEKLSGTLKADAKLSMTQETNLSTTSSEEINKRDTKDLESNKNSNSTVNVDVNIEKDKQINNRKNIFKQRGGILGIFRKKDKESSKKTHVDGNNGNSVKPISYSTTIESGFDDMIC